MRLDKPKEKRLSWDDVFMGLALLIGKRSSCKFYEIGSVFVDKYKRIISLGYNGSTAGDYHCIEVGCAKIDGNPKTKKLERCRGAHAEINGILNTQDTTRLKGATLYNVFFPCYDCMKSLNNAGIAEIVYCEEYQRIKKGGKGFEEENEAKELAIKKGIKLRKYERKNF